MHGRMTAGTNSHRPPPNSFTWNRFCRYYTGTVAKRNARTGDEHHPAYEIGPLLRQAHRRAANAFNAALAPLGIQGRHFGVLLVLDRVGSASQRQLIDRLGSDKASMVRLIDDLEHRGLCERAPATDDRRAHAVRLTPDGETLFVAAERAARSTATELQAGLTAAERATLVDLLTRFIHTDHQAGQQPSR